MQANANNVSIPFWQIRAETISGLLGPFFTAQTIYSMSLVVFGVILVVAAILGFSFYLWYLKCNKDPTQSRLLNILNGYFSIICMSGTLALFYSLKLQLPLNYGTHQEGAYQQSIRISGAHLIAISITFLLISIATIFNHFKPNIYLEISICWSHKVAIPAMACSFLVMDQVTHMSCDQSDRYIECRVSMVRKLVMIPCTAVSFLCHSVVLIDDVFSLKNSYSRFTAYIRSLTAVTPMNNDNIEMNETLPQPPYNPSHGVNHHAEFISLTTGFMTLCLFNMLVLLISFITTVFNVFNFTGPVLAILMAMAITPVVWILRNKKMKDAFLELLHI